MSTQEYRLTFGKHKNQTLSSIPPDYLSWLVKEHIYDSKPVLRAALIAANYLAPTAPDTPPSTPRKRKVSDESEIALPPSSQKKLAISKEAKQNGTMLNYDGSAYILDFGKHAGSKLRDVPSDYITWLIRIGVHEKRRDLATALREEGMLAEDSARTADPANSSTWRAPSPHSAADSRFHDPLTQSPRWISDADASRYFNLSDPLLSNMGVYLVSEEHIKRSSEFGELVAVWKGPKRWLYQVYVCAGRVGCDSPRGRDEALDEFLGKNRRREAEIMDSFGFEN